MRILEYAVPPDWAGLTVREFARKLGLSAGFLTQQRKLEDGILLNGAHARTVDVLAMGDGLAFTFPDEEMPYPAEPMELTILYEDEDYLLVDKPAGMPIHPSPGHDRDSLLNAVAYHYRQTGQSHRFRPLYRLDRDTSGVLVLGKHRAAVCAAKAEKLYFAVCEGNLSGDGVIDLPIGLRPGSRIQRECGHGDRAVTHWRSLGNFQGHTLLALWLETGRTHQIRVHLAHMGHPLAGDDLYGGGLGKITRQALHCGLLALSCPAIPGFGRKTFFAEFPDDLRAAFPLLPRVHETIKELTVCPPVSPTTCSPKTC